jgi:putative hydrolase of the HAD superfamily
MIKGALIDFDGTLVDTQAFLYQVYSQFLAERGKTGSEAEFKALIGPSLKEIVALLIEKHQLPGSLEDNYNAYFTKLMGGGGELLPGVLSFLQFAEANRIRLGVVTSAPKAWVEAILSRLNVLRYFRFVISAVDANTRGKPAPDVYLKGIEAIGLPVQELIAVEDSVAGTQSAESAGLKTFFPIWKEIQKKVEEAYYPTLISGPKLEIKEVSPPQLTQKEIDILEAIWREKTAENPHIFNGPVYFYAHHENSTLTVFLADYKWVVGRDKITSHRLIPVSVAGCTMFRGKVLWGKRALHLSKFGGFWETVPSGGLALPDPLKQLHLELEEEAAITPAELAETLFLKAVHNLKEGTLELLYQVELVRPTGTPTEEVVDVLWMEEGVAPPEPVLPISLLF